MKPRKTDTPCPIIADGPQLKHCKQKLGRDQIGALIPFEQLSNQGQQRRLRALAFKALSQYDLPSHSLSALLHRENTTFRVDLAAGERMVLRISKPGAALAAVRSEAIWLQSLSRHTDLVTPRPLPDRNGDLAS